MGTEKQESVSAILPVFNEAENIEPLVEELIAVLSKETNIYEVIAVDDGSTDDSFDVLHRLCARYPAVIKIVSLACNTGYGAALREGIQHASYQWIFIMDADKQFSPRDFVLLWQERVSYVMVLGYRLSRQDNFFRRLLGDVGHDISRRLLRCPIRDVNCGFKLFKAELLRSLRLISTGGAIYFEILFRLFKMQRYPYVEIPVGHYKRKMGRATGGTMKVIRRIIWDGLRVVRYV